MLQDFICKNRIILDWQVGCFIIGKLVLTMMFFAYYVFHLLCFLRNLLDVYEVKISDVFTERICWELPDVTVEPKEVRINRMG